MSGADQSSANAVKEVYRKAFSNDKTFVNLLTCIQTIPLQIQKQIFSSNFFNGVVVGCTLDKSLVIKKEDLIPNRCNFPQELTARNKHYVKNEFGERMAKTPCRKIVPEGFFFCSVPKHKMYAEAYRLPMSQHELGYVITKKSPTDKVVHVRLARKKGFNKRSVRDDGVLELVESVDETAPQQTCKEDDPTENVKKVTKGRSYKKKKFDQVEHELSEMPFFRCCRQNPPCENMGEHDTYPKSQFKYCSFHCTVSQDLLDNTDDEDVKNDLLELMRLDDIIKSYSIETQMDDSTLKNFCQQRRNLAESLDIGTIGCML